MAINYLLNKRTINAQRTPVTINILMLVPCHVFFKTIVLKTDRTPLLWHFSGTGQYKPAIMPMERKYLSKRGFFFRILLLKPLYDV